MGKLKKPWLVDACNEFSKKLSGHVRIKTEEIKTTTVSEETQGIVRLLDPTRVKIYCDLGGSAMDSKTLAAFINDSASAGRSRFDFVIGGAYGILPDAHSAFDKRISFSKMTFNHALFRVMLLEQLYRSVTIMNNHPYHH